ncbi:MAG: FtsW/RodA/SpoVE family cell cycle protein [Armatimonadetes bacterium]|nr:FtsW/RodA/SpoVE family cell cycle protein [Armatimonadota bacterium]
MLLGSCAVVAIGLGLLQASREVQPGALWFAAGGLFLSWLAALAVLRIARIEGDPYLLPVACLLSGIGWAMVYRLEPELGMRQALWIAFGLGAFVLISLLLRDYRALEEYRYLYLAAGVILQASVMMFGVEINGARLWFRFGSYYFQPVEIVKILMILFLAAYLRRFRTWIRLSLRSPEGRLPRRALLVLGIGWAIAEAVLILQKDLGMALLFMGIFLTMFYIATGRTDLAALAGGLFVVGAWLGYLLFSHVQVRVQAWLDPFAHSEAGGYQMAQALFSLSWGGLFGTGLGLGKPNLIPEAPTDFIFVALAEELGLLGGAALLALLVVLVQRAFRVALTAQDEFGTLLAAGLAVLVAWQSLILIAGTLKVIPMTGITLPFISYGGSSMVSNFLILALLRRMSRRPRGARGN